MIPLVRLVKQRGTEVVVVGSDLTAVPLVEMANHFITYRQLIGDREEDRERERTMERERMRTAHLARRDEAMRSREVRRTAVRELEPQSQALQRQAPVVEEAPPPRRRREPIRVESSIVVQEPVAAQTAGEQALWAGAAGVEGAPARRRRRRRRRSVEVPGEGQDQFGVLPDGLDEAEEQSEPSFEEPPVEAEEEQPVEVPVPRLVRRRRPRPAETQAQAESQPAMLAQNTPPAAVVPEMPARSTKPRRRWTRWCPGGVRRIGERRGGSRYHGGGRGAAGGAAPSHPAAASGGRTVG